MVLNTMILEMMRIRHPHYFRRITGISDQHLINPKEVILQTGKSCKDIPNRVHDALKMLAIEGFTESHQGPSPVTPETTLDCVIGG